MRVHDQKNVVGGLAANLEAKASAFECVHRWRAPGSSSILTGAADHHATAVAGTYNEGSLEDRGNHDYATGLVEQIVGNALGERGEPRP